MEALAGLPRLHSLCCYNVMFGAAAAGLKGASKLCVLELKECHVGDAGLCAVLDGFGSSSSLTWLDLSRQYWEGVCEYYHGHVSSSSPAATQVGLNALRDCLPILEQLLLTAQPNVALEWCDKPLEQRKRSLGCVLVSHPGVLQAMTRVYRGKCTHPCKPFRGARQHHSADGLVTWSESEENDDDDDENEKMQQETMAYTKCDFDDGYVTLMIMPSPLGDPVVLS